MALPFKGTVKRIVYSVFKTILVGLVMKMNRFCLKFFKGLHDFTEDQNRHFLGLFRRKYCGKNIYLFSKMFYKQHKISLGIFIQQLNSFGNLI
jgi:hypothetical protein